METYPENRFPDEPGAGADRNAAYEGRDVPIDEVLVQFPLFACGDRGLDVGQEPRDQHPMVEECSRTLPNRKIQRLSAGTAVIRNFTLPQ